MQMDLEIKRLPLEEGLQEMSGEWGSIPMLCSTSPLRPQGSLQGAQANTNSANPGTSCGDRGSFF